MKKVVLTSFIAMFAVTTAHAVGTPGAVTDLAAGTVNTITSQAYVNRTINDQVGAEQLHRKTADGDLQFTGTAEPARDITKAINLISDAVDSMAGKITGTDVTGTGAMNEGILTFTDVAINNGAVTNGKLATGAVTTDKIADGTITTTDINAANISQEVRATSTHSELATGKAVYDAMTNIGNRVENMTGSITGADVTGTGEMNEGVLTFTKVTINDGAVSNGKLATGAVTTDKIADGTITTTDINAANISQDVSVTSTHSELATGKAVWDVIQTVTMSAETCVAPNILVGDPANPTHFICQTVVQ